MTKRIQITWTPERIELLRKLYPTCPKKDLATILGVSVEAIYAQAKVIGCETRKNSAWTQDEIDYLYDHHETMTATEIGKSLNRSRNSVVSKASGLGLKCFVKDAEALPEAMQKSGKMIEPTPTGCIVRGIDFIKPRSALRPDNRTGRFSTLAYAL